MNPSKSPLEMRRAARLRRRAPQAPQQIHIAWNDTGHLPDSAGQTPCELTLEVTDPEGQLAQWCHDLWWTCVVAQLGEAIVTLHIAPMPGALLNPVVLHELEMLERVAPRWRVIGHAFADDLKTPDDIGLVARSAYHEVRFAPHLRHGLGRRDEVKPPSLETTMADIRRAQVQLGADRPILVLLGGETRTQADAGNCIVGVNKSETIA